MRAKISDFSSHSFINSIPEREPMISSGKSFFQIRSECPQNFEEIFEIFWSLYKTRYPIILSAI